MCKHRTRGEIFRRNWADVTARPAAKSGLMLPFPVHSGGHYRDMNLERFVMKYNDRTNYCSMIR
jgi:hypothetical protein